MDEAGVSGMRPGERAATGYQKASDDDFVNAISAALDRLTAHAAGLPDKSDLSFHRTLDRKFAKSLDETSSRLLELTETLLSQLSTVTGSSTQSTALGSKLKVKGRRKLADQEDLVEGYKRSIGGVVDGLLEDAVSLAISCIQQADSLSARGS